MNEPKDEDCCHSGCTNCIFDVYEKQKNKIKENSFHANNALSPIQYRPFILVGINEDSERTNVYTFAPKDAEVRVHYKPGEHAMLKQLSSQEEESNEQQSDVYFSRAYTLIPYGQDLPTSFSTVIKLYDNGKMSAAIRRWTVGDVCFWRGPYNGAGEWTYQVNSVSQIIMVCMGTGIAPMYSLAKSITANENDDTIINLLYSSRTPGEICLRKQVRELCGFWNFKCIHFLSQGFNETEKKFNETFVPRRIKTVDLVDAFQKPNKYFALVCGSEQFNVETKETLLSIGVSVDRIVIFS